MPASSAPKPQAVRFAEPASAASLTAVLEPAMADAVLGAGPSPGLVSFALDLAGASGAHSGPAEVSAWVERATRTLAFVSADVRAPDGRLLAAASAVFALRSETGA